MPLIESDVSLQRLNTFGLPARARRFARIDSLHDLHLLISGGALAGGHLILGGGSNTIFEGDVDELVLQVALRGRRLLASDRHGWLVEAGAGENWHDFVGWTLSRGWPGLENLSLIPGTAGAAPIQNIGAYGLEMAECFDSLDAVELASGASRRFEADECEFGYRDSVFKGREQGRWLITAVRFRLARDWQPRTAYRELAEELAAAGLQQPTPEEVSRAVIAVRSRKLPDPARIGNAGSFFKNPVVDRATWQRIAGADPRLPAYPQPDGRIKLAAGWLIEQCGWRGRSLGPVGAFESQALVLVNRGGALGSDVRRAAEAIRGDVRKRFGIELETEPSFVGGPPAAAG